MTINALLVAILVIVLVALTAIEAYTAVKGLPTISERLQRIAKTAPLATVIVSLLVGVLMAHFFGVAQPGC